SLCGLVRLRILLESCPVKDFYSCNPFLKGETHRMISKKVTLVFTLLFTALAATQAFGQTIYNNIPSPLPGNLPSIAFEANQAEQFGDQLQFAAGQRTLTTVTQGM